MFTMPSPSVSRKNTLITPFVGFSKIAQLVPNAKCGTIIDKIGIMCNKPRNGVSVRKFKYAKPNAKPVAIIADPNVNKKVFNSTVNSFGSVYTRTYFSNVNAPNAPKPSEKLPTMSIMAGASVNKPTTATSNQVKKFALRESMALIRYEAAATRIDIERHVVARRHGRCCRYAQHARSGVRGYVHLAVLT